MLENGLDGRVCWQVGPAPAQHSPATLATMALFLLSLLVLCGCRAAIAVKQNKRRAHQCYDRVSQGYHTRVVSTLCKRAKSKIY